jgi:hypothetical protein
MTLLKQNSFRLLTLYYYKNIQTQPKLIRDGEEWGRPSPIEYGFDVLFFIPLKSKMDIKNT